MGSRLLCWVTLCVLGVGHTRAGVVSQSPGYRVAGRGQNVTLRTCGGQDRQDTRYEVTVTGEVMTLECHQTDNHGCMYWYQPDPGHGLRLIHYTYDVGNTEKVEISNGYSISSSNTEDFYLTPESYPLPHIRVLLCQH
ncbi:hypothetical protein R6Z07F_006149 [Ovis aries]